MIETIQAFIQSIKERKHVLLLIENTVLTIEFMIEDQITAISLKNGEVTIGADTNQTSLCLIRGDKEKIRALINGEEKLRALIFKGHLQCSAPFRTILLLESFFYLGKIETLIKRIS